MFDVLIANIIKAVGNVDKIFRRLYDMLRIYMPSVPFTYEKLNFFNPPFSPCITNSFNDIILTTNCKKVCFPIMIRSYCDSLVTGLSLDSDWGQISDGIVLIYERIPVWSLPGTICLTITCCVPRERSTDIVYPWLGVIRTKINDYKLQFTVDVFTYATFNLNDGFVKTNRREPIAWRDIAW